MPTINRRGGPRANSGRPKGERTKVVRLPLDIALAARRAAEARGGNMSGIGTFLSAEARLSASAPLVTASVACGVPSPAEDSMDRPLDLNELHGIGLPSVFLVRVHGDSMIGVGLHHGDIAVVNKAVEAKHGRIVVACLNGDFTLKRYLVKRGRVILHPENTAYPDIEVPAEADFQVWGVVTGSSRVF